MSQIHIESGSFLSRLKAGSHVRTNSYKSLRYEVKLMFSSKKCMYKILEVMREEDTVFVVSEVILVFFIMFS